MPISILERLRLWSGFFVGITYPRDLPLVWNALRCRPKYTVPASIWTSVDPIAGFLSIKEAGLLYWAACQPTEGPVLELGSFEGRSTILFALCGRRVHSVDAWSNDVSDLSAYGEGASKATDSYERFNENLRRNGAADKVSIHRGLSQQVGRGWTTHGAILFVDAGHTYADVKADLEIWTPWLLRDGILMMHDVLGDRYFGVTRAASELRGKGWKVLASAGSIVAFTRKASH